MVIHKSGLEYQGSRKLLRMWPMVGFQVGESRCRPDDQRAFQDPGQPSLVQAARIRRQGYRRFSTSWIQPFLSDHDALRRYLRAPIRVSAPRILNLNCSYSCPSRLLRSTQRTSLLLYVGAHIQRKTCEGALRACEVSPACLGA